MKIDWCKWLGHKWIQIYVEFITGEKFIATYCQKCNLGRKEWNDFVFSKNTNTFSVCSYNSKYFITPKGD